MGVSKVDFFGKTLIDLTSDTVTSRTLAKGQIAHNAAGEVIIGTMESGSYTPIDEYLSEPFDVDIDNATGTIIQKMEDATITTTFSSDGNEDIVTSLIEMIDGNYNYIRETKITSDGTKDHIRTTLKQINK